MYIFMNIERDWSEIPHLVFSFLINFQSTRKLRGGTCSQSQFALQASQFTIASNERE